MKKIQDVLKSNYEKLLKLVEENNKNKNTSL